MAQRKWLPLVLLITVCAFLFYDLGYIGLTSPDEARYSEVAREMLTSSGWVVPNLNGEPRVNKPPLTYWLLAASYRLFGLHEWAGRLVSALAALGVVLLTVTCGTQLAGRTAGMIAGVVTASSIFFFIEARLTTTDMLLCFWFTGAVVSGLLSLTGERRNPLGLIAFFLFASGGTLTKGPIALALPGLIVSCACAWDKRWQYIHWPAMGLGVILYVLLSAPWFVLLERELPGAALAFFARENVERFTNGVDHTGSSILYYVPILALGALPWTALVPAALWHEARIANTSSLTLHERFLVRAATLWWLLPFVVFSASTTRLAPYILPCFPAIGLLVGRVLARELTGIGERRARWTWMTSQGVLLPLLAIAGSMMLVRETALTTREMTGLCVWVVAAGMVGGVVTIVAAWRGGVVVGVPVLLGTHYLFVIAAMHLHAATEPFEELRPVALQLRNLGEGASPLVCYNHAEPAISFYLGKVIPTVDREELAHRVRRDTRVLCIVDRGYESEIRGESAWRVRRVAGNHDSTVLEVTPGNHPWAPSLGPYCYHRERENRSQTRAFSEMKEHEQ